MAFIPYSYYKMSFREIEILSDLDARLELQTDNEGHGCIPLAAGSYTAGVKLSSAANDAGMR